MINQEVLNFVSLLEPIYSGGVKLNIYSSANWDPEMFALLACFAGKVQSFAVMHGDMNFAEFFFVKQLLLENTTCFSVFKEINGEVSF